jgi:hypothetical protein
LVPDKSSARILFNNAFPGEHLIVLASTTPDENSKASVRVFRYRVGLLPFSHYFPDDGPEKLAITYTAPNRRKNKVVTTAHGEARQEGLVQQELITLGEEVEELKTTPSEEVRHLSQGAKINLMPPRGMMFLDAKLVSAQADVSIIWKQFGKEKTLSLAANSRGKKICDIDKSELEQADFNVL